MTSSELIERYESATARLAEIHAEIEACEAEIRKAAKILASRQELRPLILGDDPKTYFVNYTKAVGRRPIKPEEFAQYAKIVDAVT